MSAPLNLQQGAGNAAVARLVQRFCAVRDAGSCVGSHGPGGTDGADGPAPMGGQRRIQRAIFIGGKYLSPQDRWLAESLPNAIPLAEDDVMRHFVSGAELEEYAAGITDYIGNLPADVGQYSGTWVRFAREGLNVLGENHSVVTLDHVRKAVGPRDEESREEFDSRYLYERFSADDLTHLPNVRGVMAEIWDPELDRIHGLDSYLASLGFNLSLISEALLDDNQLEQSGEEASVFPERRSADVSTAHFDGLAGGVIKRMWAFVRDVEAEVAARPAPPPSEAGIVDSKAALVEMYHHVPNPFRVVLDALRWRIRMGRFIFGTCRSPELRIDFRTRLSEFCDKVVEILASQTASDPVTAVVRPQADIPQYFEDCREAVMARRLRVARDAEFRYVGMGRDHVEHLVESGRIPDGATVYDMAEVDLMRFKRETDDMRRQTRRLRAREQRLAAPPPGSLRSGIATGHSGDEVV